jgi:hypothetical protein
VWRLLLHIIEYEKLTASKAVLCTPSARFWLSFLNRGLRLLLLAVTSITLGASWLGQGRLGLIANNFILRRHSKLAPRTRHENGTRAQSPQKTTSGARNVARAMFRTSIFATESSWRKEIKKVTCGTVTCAGVKRLDIDILQYPATASKTARFGARFPSDLWLGR